MPAMTAKSVVDCLLGFAAVSSSRRSLSAGVTSARPAARTRSSRATFTCSPGSALTSTEGDSTRLTSEALCGVKEGATGDRAARDRSDLVRPPSTALTRTLWILPLARSVASLFASEPVVATHALRQADPTRYEPSCAGAEIAGGFGI